MVCGARSVGITWCMGEGGGAGGERQTKWKKYMRDWRTLVIVGLSRTLSYAPYTLDAT
jgi:hypothetical protein